MDDIKVSIITICRNSAQDISKTLRSVLNQSYDNIEYIIVDGKSEDRTMEIIESYKKAFQEKGYTYRIISESDNGIYDAMNKGIDVCTGNLVGLINSGD
ncbi:MAG: glycosyltransferase [Enterocloster bolteae]